MEIFIVKFLEGSNAPAVFIEVQAEDMDQALELAKDNYPDSIPISVYLKWPNGIGNRQRLSIDAHRANPPQHIAAAGYDNPGYALNI
jgi:hypothetical protein